MPEKETLAIIVAAFSLLVSIGQACLKRRKRKPDLGALAELMDRVTGIDDFLGEHEQTKSDSREALQQARELDRLLSRYDAIFAKEKELLIRYNNELILLDQRQSRTEGQLQALSRLVDSYIAD